MESELFDEVHAINGDGKRFGNLAVAASSQETDGQPPVALHNEVQSIIEDTNKFQSSDEDTKDVPRITLVKNPFAFLGSSFKNHVERGESIISMTHSSTSSNDALVKMEPKYFNYRTPPYEDLIKNESINSVNNAVEDISSTMLTNTPWQECIEHINFQIADIKEDLPLNIPASPLSDVPDSDLELRTSYEPGAEIFMWPEETLLVPLNYSEDFNMESEYFGYSTLANEDIKTEYSDSAKEDISIPTLCIQSIQQEYLEHFNIQTAEIKAHPALYTDVTSLKQDIAANDVSSADVALNSSYGQSSLTCAETSMLPEENLLTPVTSTASQNETRKTRSNRNIKQDSKKGVATSIKTKVKARAPKIKTRNTEPRLSWKKGKPDINAEKRKTRANPKKEKLNEFPKPLKLEKLTSFRQEITSEMEIATQLPRPMYLKCEKTSKQAKTFNICQLQPLVRIKRLNLKDIKAQKKGTKLHSWRGTSLSVRSNMHSRNASTLKSSAASKSNDTTANQRRVSTNSVRAESMADGSTCDSAISTNSQSSSSLSNSSHLLIQIAAERAFINNHLRHFRYSPIQFELYNNWNDLCIFLKYLLGRSGDV